VPFERYADDALCHCRTRMRAEQVLAQLTQRFAECGLTLHPLNPSLSFGTTRANRINDLERYCGAYGTTFV